MAYAKNKVVAGDCKDWAVVSVLGEVSISNGSAMHLTLSMDTVESYEIITDEHLKSAASGVNPWLTDDALPVLSEMQDGSMLPENKRAHYIAIQFKDGKKSLLEVDRDLCIVIVKNCLSEATVHCGVTPEKIKSCDPHNKTNCPHCPCFRCILWPKCCYGRIYGRRAAYRKHGATETNQEQESES